MTALRSILELSGPYFVNCDIKVYIRNQGFELYDKAQNRVSTFSFHFCKLKFDFDFFFFLVIPSLQIYLLFWTFWYFQQIYIVVIFLSSSDSKLSWVKLDLLPNKLKLCPNRIVKLNASSSWIECFFFMTRLSPKDQYLGSWVNYNLNEEFFSIIILFKNYDRRFRSWAFLLKIQRSDSWTLNSQTVCISLK